MREFAGLGQFAAFMTAMVVEVDAAKRHALEKAAKIVETEAKDVIGTYRYGWPGLAPSTLARKAADTPLLESGEMRESISHTIDGDEAKVGSPLDRALYHELGTKNIPPRSFLVGAVTHKLPEIQHELGAHVMKVLTT